MGLLDAEVPRFRANGIEALTEFENPKLLFTFSLYFELPLTANVFKVIYMLGVTEIGPLILAILVRNFNKIIAFSLWQISEIGVSTDEI